MNRLIKNRNFLHSLQSQWTQWLSLILAGCFLIATLFATGSPTSFLTNSLEVIVEHDFSKDEEWKHEFEAYKLVQIPDETLETIETLPSEINTPEKDVTNPPPVKTEIEVDTSAPKEIDANEVDKPENHQVTPTETATKNELETAEVSKENENQLLELEKIFDLKLENLKIEPKNPTENKKYSSAHYRRPRVPYKKNFSTQLKGYQSSYTIEDQERAKERIEQAQTYLEAGEDRVFIEILNNIIRQYHYSPEAALAALRLGDYHETSSSVTSVLMALDYYVYIINLHSHSGYEEETLFRLGTLLYKERFYAKSEEVLRYLIKLVNKRNRKNSAYTSIWQEEAEKSLITHYVSFLRWGEENAKKSVINEYQSKITNFMKTKIKLTKRKLKREQREKTVVDS